MDEPLKSNLQSTSLWLRLLFMLLFAILIQVAAGVMWVLVVLQFLFHLFCDDGNRKLSQFGESLANYIYQCWQFLNFNSDDKPYPFRDWPQGS